MWAIFIAIFGGLYLAFKFGSDRAASKQADAKLEQQKLGWEAWDSLVIDSKLEAEIESSLITPEPAKFLKDEALKLIRTFHGLEYADFNEYYNAKYKDYYVRAMVAYIELVRHGKLPELKHSEVPNYLELSLDIRPSKRARIEFCKWLEETMQSNGVPEAKLYYKGEDYASFAWEPYVFDFSKAVRLTDPELESKMMGISTEEMDLQNSSIIEQKRKRTEQG